MHCRCSFVLTLLQSAALLFLLAISVFTTQDQLLWLFLLISYDPKMLCLCSDAKIKFFFVPTLKVDLKASCEVKAKLKKAKVTVKRRVLLILFALKTNNILKKQAEKSICKLNRSQWDRIQKLSETTNQFSCCVKKASWEVMVDTTFTYFCIALVSLNLVSAPVSCDFLWQGIEVCLFCYFSAFLFPIPASLSFWSLWVLTNSLTVMESQFSIMSLWEFLFRLHFAYFIHSSHWLCRHGLCLGGFGLSLV